MFANYNQGFTTRFGNSYIPAFGGAIEYRPTRWLPLRTGISIGGKEGIRVGTGFAMEFRHYQLTIGVAQLGGIFQETKGLTLALEQVVSF